MPVFDKMLALQLAMTCQHAYDDKPAYSYVFKNDLEQAIAFHNGKNWVIAFRGTIGKVIDWLFDFDATMSERYIRTPQGQRLTFKAHKGFWDKWAMLSDRILAFVNSLPAGERVAITGHSQGGPVACLAAISIPPDRLEAVYTFGQPRFTDQQGATLFAMTFADRYWRVAHHNDVVTHVPFQVPLNSLDYVHFGPLALLGEAASISFPATLPDMSVDLFKDVDDHYIQKYVAALQHP